MKGVAFLALVAFIAAFLPNRVEGKCYACVLDAAPVSCKEFEKASASERKKFVLPEVANCKKCLTTTSNGEVTARSCFFEEEGTETETGVTDLGNGLTAYICEGDLCNGDNYKSSKSTDDKSSKSTAGSLKSWVSLARVATAFSFMIGPLF